VKVETRRSGGGQTVEAYVLVTSLPDGRVVNYTLPPVGEVFIGRDETCEIHIPDDSVSRRHARVIGGSPPQIEDLGSTNGTRLLGHVLRPGMQVALRFGSVVEIGSVIGFVQPRSAAPALHDEAAPISQRSAQAQAHARAPEESFVLRDAAMIELYKLIDVVAPSKMSILVLGETGVGKDVYAETIHKRSDRAVGPFLRLNCAAMPENLLEAELFGFERGAFTGAVQAKPGLFESADSGTVFLDEIGEMPLVTQAKLLRVLESGEVMRIGSLKPKRVDVRFVAATNRDLESLSQTGQFRSDLFFRLNGVSVTIPPLRKRREDIVPLAELFLRLATAGRGRSAPMLAPASVEKLVSYRWPGNIRELKNVVERAALLARGGVIEPEHLGGTRPVEVEYETRSTAIPPPQAPHVVPIRDEFAEIERRRILEAMERCGGNQSRAKMLGIARGTLIKRLEQYGYVRPRKGQE
jgi:transcriptional regulator with PAS, ATPase and Fis domain